MKKYTDKELVYKCMEMWYKIAENLRKDSLLHTLNLKHQALSEVAGNDDELKNELRDYHFCFTCYIAKNNCKKCLLLDFWLNGKEYKSDELFVCANKNSPYFEVTEIENGTKRYTYAMSIAEAAKKLYEEM
jgi:hypothetical protein